MVGVLAGLAIAVMGTMLVWLGRTLARERAQLAQAQRELQLIADLMGSVSDADPQRSIQNLVTALVQTQLCRAAVLLGLSDTGTLEVRASAYGPGETVWSNLTDIGLHQALEAKVPLATTDGDMCLPILADGDPVGVLLIRGETGTGSALQVSVKISSVSMLAIKRQQRQTALSTTDGLTGLFNHRHFQQMLGVALGMAYLQGEPLSVILLDIDRFKSVNDTYGHLLGDLVLREIGYLLRRHLPSDAVAARYGGEEMVVLLQGESALRAEAIAEELRQVIAAHQVLDFTTGAKLSVTVSLGVAAYELGQGKSRLIARADEALYTSKREGRDRVTVAQPSGVPGDLFS